ncbi:ABC transporter substrate-binding protein [Falsigemmobacter faecalis]|uniref:ABC transporter substrate-binding protein n=1 Tax=Falsigemmobacter faecalis TaxID=2488730 RepID=A0A3P3DT52_9RHOB|nr:ABC transporter substrate-binding protein [Falsigemmobacter faecalis]RRH77345.1 ABC transporter substrate-binding protein [Falsigemmobacter faecalis]
MKLDVRFGTAGLALAAALTLGASPAALMAATPADTLVIADKIDDIVSLDPAEAFEFSGVNIINNTYDSLIELDPNKPGELIPGLAESWDVSEDGLTFTFKMKEGITFASGNPVRAEDAAWSLQRVIKLNKTPAFVLAQFGFTPENVEEMIKADGDTVVITLAKPFAPSMFYNCLTAGLAGIVDKETVMANEVNGDMGNEWLKSNSAGTGAYVLRSFKPQDSYVLDRRDGYWRGDAKLKRVRVNHIPESATQRLQLEKGDIDIARGLSNTDVAGLEGKADVKVEEAPKGYIYYIAANQKNEILKKPEVMDALRWAVDYKGITDTVLKGQMMVQQGFLPAGYLGSLDETPYSLDVAKAKELLAAAGYPNGFEVTMTVRNDQLRMEMAQAIQNTLGQAGIKVTLKPGAGAEVLGDYRARNHELTLQSWGPDYPDPHTNASTFAWNPDNADEAKLTGVLAWRNAWDPGELTAAVDAAVVERDTETRKAMYEDMQRKFRDDSGFVPMFQEIAQTALRANVSGFHTGGTIDSATYWYTEKN